MTPAPALTEATCANCRFFREWEKHCTRTEIFRNGSYQYMKVAPGESCDLHRFALHSPKDNSNG